MAIIDNSDDDNEQQQECVQFSARDGLLYPGPILSLHGRFCVDC